MPDSVTYAELLAPPALIVLDDDALDAVAELLIGLAESPAQPAPTVGAQRMAG